MSEDRRSRFEIDVGAALDAVEVATFEADELFNRVLIRTRLPTDRRMMRFKMLGQYYIITTMRCVLCGGRLNADTNGPILPANK